MTEREQLFSSIDEIEVIARQSGLDFFNTEFKLVPATKMYEYGAYGLPGRFSHWTHVKEYYRMKTMYDYGLSKIYELVVNTDPALAFLMESNDIVENEAVAAHVFAHVDFFKHNNYFAYSDRQMIPTVLVHAERMKQFANDFGEETVEEWLDHALTINMNFDSRPQNFQKPTADEYLIKSREEGKKNLRVQPAYASPYDDLLNLGVKKQEEKKQEVKVQLPYADEPDLLWLIAEFSPMQLDDWQKDILYMVRNEQQYFVPQMQTKIMNEGWAAYWHQKLMRQMFAMDKLTVEDMVNFARMHAGVVAPSRNSINPYYIGSKIFEDINRKFEGIPHHAGETEKNWLDEEIDPKSYIGNPRYDIFKVREEYNDQRFLRDYLSDYLIPDLDLYIYELKGQEWVVTEKDPEKIRNMIAEQMVNFGRPVINVPIDGADYNKKRELYLKHSTEGEREINLAWADKTLRHIYAMWGKPVYLETVIAGKKTLLTCDGNSVTTKAI